MLPVTRGYVRVPPLSTTSTLVHLALDHLLVVFTAARLVSLVPLVSLRALLRRFLQERELILGWTRGISFGAPEANNFATLGPN